MTLAMITIDSPLGVLRLYATNDELSGVYLPDQHVDLAAPTARTETLARAASQLAEYFAGRRTSFDVPLGARGTGFQQRVWRALEAIPFAETRSYGQLAKLIGRPSAGRAVGHANSKNPISIIVPCHRVIAANGELTGYAGGMPAKRWLLDHERRIGERRKCSESAHAGERRKCSESAHAGERENIGTAHATC